MTNPILATQQFLYSAAGKSNEEESDELDEEKHAKWDEEEAEGERAKEESL